ncbi:MAG: PIN domain-containing protein [Actinomycetota bacterium]
MTSVDTSVAVAAFGEWHRLNVRARQAVERSPALPAHCLLETYSVLSGFPPPHRAAAPIVNEWLNATFKSILPAPPARDQFELVGTMVAAGLIGGSIYDGLVALTVKLAGAGPLLTADARAGTVYKLVGVSWELVGF